MAKEITKKITSRIANFTEKFGLDIYVFLSFRRLPRYLKELYQFTTKGGKVNSLYMFLGDYKTQAGVISGHYFHQDLLVASFIHQQKPKRHIDVGSRIDGFVAHVASFMPIEIIDIRPLEIKGVKTIKYVVANLMDSVKLPIADSVSCLHSLEHFGLGRYGDPIDPDGHLKGFKNLVSMVEPGGMLYISFPIGRKTRVDFNGERVFHPRDIFTWNGCECLKLCRFDYVDDLGDLNINTDVISKELNVTYGCGIYSFKKI